MSIKFPSPSTMNRTSSLFKSATLSGSLLAITVAASTIAGDWPAVISQMPDDAQIILCTKPMNEFNDHFNQFTAAIEVAQLGFVPGPISTLAMVGVNTEAMNLDGSIGIAVLKNHWNDDIPPVLAFIPVTDYNAWIGSFNAQPVADTNLSTINFGQKFGNDNGEVWYARSAGSFAVLGMSKNLVTEYSKGNGNIGKWQEVVGRLGEGIMENCDIAALVDFDGLQDQIKEGMNQSFEEMDNNFENIPAGAMQGMDPEQLQKMMQAYRHTANMMVDELRAGAFGIRYGAEGIAIDGAVQWVENGEMAAMIPGTNGKTRNVLNRMQNQPFMFAAAGDLSGFNMEKIMSIFMDAMPEQMTMGMGNIGTDMWKHTDGFAMAMYPSPAGLMGGLFNSMGFIYTGDGKALRTDMKNMMDGLNGKEVQGIKYTTTYQDNAKTIAGVSVDSWSMSFDGPPEVAQQLNQSMMMIYGPAGPGGLIATLDDGIVMTMSKNSKLLEALIKSAKANDGLGNNKYVKAVDGILSANPSAAFYIGPGAILKQVGPMASMFLPGLTFDDETLGSIPPIAGSMSITKAGIQGTFAIPAPTIKTGMKIYNDFQQARVMNEGNQGNGKDEDPDIF